MTSVYWVTAKDEPPELAAPPDRAGGMTTAPVPLPDTVTWAAQSWSTRLGVSSVPLFRV